MDDPQFDINKITVEPPPTLGSLIVCLIVLVPLAMGICYGIMWIFGGG